MNEKCLIIGGDSFLGFSLKNWIKNNTNCEVFTTTRKISRAGENIIFCPADNYLDDTICKLQPDKIINCIGISDYESAERYKLKALEANYLLVYKILEAARLYSPKSKVINLGSIKEFDHLDFYSASKRAARELVYCYNNIYNLWVSQPYLSNISGFGQSPERFLVPKIAEFIKKLKNNKDYNKKLSIGNIESEIKLLHVDSFCELLWSCFNDRPTPFLIDGFKITVKRFLEKSFERIGITDWQKYIEIDEKLVRPTTSYSEYLEMTGLKLKPRESLDQTIDKLLK